MNFRRYFITLIALSMVSLPSCRKFDGLPQVEVLVQDSWDNSPISDVRVGIMEDQGDFWSSQLVVVESHFTNDFGTCKFDREFFHEHLELEHDDYSPEVFLDAIDTEVAELTSLSINPETWVRLTVQDTGIVNPVVESIKIFGAGLNTTFYTVEDGDWRIRKPSVERPDHELSVEVDGEIDYNYSIDIALLRFDTLDLTIQY